MKNANISIIPSPTSVSVASSRMIHSSSVSHTKDATSHPKETPYYKDSERNAASSNGAISGGVIAGFVVMLLATAVGIAGVWR